jgi:prepilin-type N-terminal cleavage/methylation domain-containing protein
MSQNGSAFLKKRQNGFTIIELITVIGVLGILGSILLAIVNPLEQFNKAADSRRKADLAQIQKALESYYQDHGRYPYMYKDVNNGNVSQISKTGTPQGDGTSTGVVPWGSDFRPYMDVLPIEQKKAKKYGYWVDPTGQSYALYASLDRGGKDPQACKKGDPCTNALTNSIVCGGTCNYGVSSPNIAP